MEERRGSLLNCGREKAAQQGSATTRFRVTPDEAKRIREAEATGGQSAGLKIEKAPNGIKTGVRNSHHSRIAALLPESLGQSHNQHWNEAPQPRLRDRNEQRLAVGRTKRRLRIAGGYKTAIPRNNRPEIHPEPFSCLQSTCNPGECSPMPYRRARPPSRVFVSRCRYSVGEVLQS